MKYSIPLALFLVISLMLVGQGRAQKARQKPVAAAKPGGAADKLPVISVGLGHTERASGSIPKRTFDSLAVRGLGLFGPGSAAARIQGFNFTYAERTMYEDSIGNPLLLTDFLTEYCYGDTLTSSIRNNLFSRTKPGDTAYFDQIKVQMASGQTAKGRAMKFVIVP